MTEKIHCMDCKSEAEGDKLTSYSDVVIPKGWDCMWDGHKYSIFKCEDCGKKRV